MQASHMLAKRILSGLIIFIIGILLVFSGGWIYITGISLILSYAVWEFIHMYREGMYNPDPFIPAISTFVITIVTSFDNPIITSLSYSLSIFVILIQSILVYKNNKETASVDLAIELAALGFITFLGSYLIRIRSLENGLLWIMISIFPACAGDIGAYIFGSLFGKHKLSPLLSPKKTIEGYLSGVFAAVCTGYITGIIISSFEPTISVSACMLVGGAVGAFSPLGDLSKSIVKRGFGLKNTGEVIPGHGGILDRIDTWLWAGPIAFFLIEFFFL